MNYLRCSYCHTLISTDGGGVMINLIFEGSDPDNLVNY